MSFIRKKFILVLAAVMLLSSISFALPAMAAEDGKKVEVFGFSIRITDNDNSRSLLDFNKDAVYLSDDVLVPATAIKAPMNLVLKWDKSINTLLVGENKKDRIVIQFPLNKNEFKVSYPDKAQQKGYFDVVSHPRAPMMKDGTVLIPLKFVAETLGYEWSFETFPALIQPKNVPGLSSYISTFKTLKAKYLELDNKYIAADKEHKRILSQWKYRKFQVSGTIDHIENQYFVVRGTVIDTRADKMVKDNEFVYVQSGNSGVLNERFESASMYKWSDAKFKNTTLSTYSENKPVALVKEEKPVLEKMAKLRAQMKATQEAAVGTRNKAYQAINDTYDAHIEKTPTAELRLRYEQMIHHIKAARELGWFNGRTESGTLQSVKEHTSHKDSRAVFFSNLIANSLVKSTADLKLKLIGDLQTLEAYSDSNVKIRKTQKMYADLNPDLVINTAVTNRLKNEGVLALMERGSKDNKDYDVAYFLVNQALNIKDNNYASTLKNSKKQIELRFLRYDTSWWSVK